MRKLWFVAVLIFALLLSACAAPAAPSAPAGGEEAAPAQEAAPAAEEAAPAEEAMGPSEMHIAWPYQVPPTGHFNTFVTNGLSLSIYQHLMEPPLFMYMWADESWLPMAGESWEWVDDTTLRAHLRQGAVWSDGSPFTSQDVLDTFAIERLMNRAVWRFITDVQAVDDYTVDFILKEPSTTVPRRVLRETFIRASSTYGEWADKVRALVDQGLTPEDDEWKALRQEFSEFRPDDMVVLGAFKIDKDSITESQMILNKVETSFQAENVKFDRLVNFNGETPTITPLVLAKEIDYATHGFPPATERQFIEEGIRIIRAPLYSGPALYFNHKIHPFEVKEFRQALAYVIDRAENGTISLGDSGRRHVYMTGFSDNLAPLWLSEETMNKLNTYDPNLEKAEQMLMDLGFSRDDDGVWKDDTGKRMEFELIAPAEYADWSAAAENVAEQLTNFGIKVSFRGVNFQQHPVEVNNGNFELAIRQWGAGNPHPHFAYNTALRTFNQQLGGEGNPDQPGMYFNLKQKTDVVGEVDLGELTDAAGLGNDIEKQKEIVNTLALAYNELLPQIPLWERYGNNPAPDVRVTGWPADDDPVYKNGPYADPFVVVLLVTGRLEPVK